MPTTRSAPRPVEFVERSCDDEFCPLHHCRAPGEIREHIALLEGLAAHTRPRQPSFVSRAEDLGVPKCGHLSIVVLWSRSWHYAGTMTEHWRYNEARLRSDNKADRRSWTIAMSLHADCDPIHLVVRPAHPAVLVPLDTVDHLEPWAAEEIGRRFVYNDEYFRVVGDNGTWTRPPGPIIPKIRPLFDF